MFKLRVPIAHTFSSKATLSRHKRCNWRIGTTLPRQADMEVIKRLEDQAMEAHLQAQELNKQGKYGEAAERYAGMRRLDALALELTQLQAAAAHLPQRAAGAILACLTADAAATSVQWIYDLGTLKRLLEQRQQGVNGAICGPLSLGLEFYEPVQSPFLPQYSCGRNSPYGEQTLLLLQSLAEQRGLHCGRYADLYYSSYSSKDFDGYTNASTVAFLRNYSRGLKPPATGAEDQQADTVARLAPIVAAFNGDPRLLQLVEAVTRVTQNTAAAVAWACTGAAVLERVMLEGRGVTQAVRATLQELRDLQRQQGQGPPTRLAIDQHLAADVADQLERVLDLQQQPHAVAVDVLGRNCHMPNALQTPLHTVMHQEWLLQQRPQQQMDIGDVQAMGDLSKQQVFVAAIRDALAAGGCSASRCSYAGALLGAWLGPHAVPDCWLAKYGSADRVRTWAEQICRCRNDQY
eukprot:gene11315-11465_t